MKNDVVNGGVFSMVASSVTPDRDDGLSKLLTGKPGAHVKHVGQGRLTGASGRYSEAARYLQGFASAGERTGLSVLKLLSRPTSLSSLYTRPCEGSVVENAR